MTVAARLGFWLAGLVMARSCWNVGCEGLHCYQVIDIPRTHSTLAQNHPAGETHFTVGRTPCRPTQVAASNGRDSCCCPYLPLKVRLLGTRAK
jgi:hypothetical protein